MDPSTSYNTATASSSWMHYGGEQSGLSTYADFGRNEVVRDEGQYGKPSASYSSSSYLQAPIEPRPREPLRRSQSSSALPTVSSTSTSHSAPPLSATTSIQGESSVPWFTPAQQSAQERVGTTRAFQQGQLQPIHFQPPPATASTLSPPQHQPLSPPDDARRRRHHSAQPEYTAPPHPSSRYGPARHLTISVPPPPSQTSPPQTYETRSFATPTSHQMMAVPSREEVDQFLVEMGEMLGPEAMAAISPPMRAQPSQTQPMSASFLSPPPHHTHYPSTNPGAVYNVSGVLLDDEDMALLNDSSQDHFLPTTPPASAPAYKTSFGRQQWSGPSTAPLQVPREYLQSHSTYLSPANPYPSDFHRPTSAPSTPEPFTQGKPPMRRRVSAMDLGPRQHQHQHPYSIPSPSPSPSPTRSTARGKKPGGISFINFTANDSTTLLNGVAPSGSSKRKREEEDEAERKRQRA